MNAETGEVREVENEEPPGIDEVEISAGEVIEIKGVPCRLVNVNPGKRRLTFTPIGKKTAKIHDDAAALTARVRAEMSKRARGQVGQ